MLKNSLAIIAATLMATTPIAAQANTRAMSAGVSLDSVQTSVITEDDDDDDRGIYIILGALLVGGLLLALIAADTSEGGDASPGTGG